MRFPVPQPQRVKVVSSWPDYGRDCIVAVCEDGDVFVTPINYATDIAFPWRRVRDKIPLPMEEK